MDLGGHGRKRFQVVALGRAGRAADAVTARTAAQQDDHIAGRGALAADVVCRSGRYHGTAFQTLGDVALVIELRHMTGGKADLVAVGGVARGAVWHSLPGSVLSSATLGSPAPVTRMA